MSIELDVGTLPNGFKDWTTVLVRFHRFANLPTTRDAYVESPDFFMFWSSVEVETLSRR